MFVLYSLLFMFLLLYLWVQRRFYFLTWKLGGPIGLPFIGNVESLSHKTVLEFISKVGKKYSSPFTVWCGPLCIVCVKDPVNVGRVLNSPECNKKSFFYKPFTKIVGSGLVTNCNPEWSLHRKLLNPIFKTTNLMQFIPIFDTKTKKLCKQLKELSQLNRPFHIAALFMEYVYDVSWENVGGHKVNLQYGKSDHLLQAFVKMLDTVSKMIINPLYRFPILIKVFDSNFYNESERNRKIFEEYFDENYKRFTKTEMEPASISHFNFMKYLVNLNKKGLFTPKELKGEGYHFFMTAMETQSKALLHIVTLLAMHPEWQEKLHQDIEERFPDKNVELDFKDIQNTSLIDLVIKEMLRLLPVIPLLSRETIVDFVLFDDVVIPKGTNIVLDIYSLHRDPEYWGPDVLEFNPYRFLREEVSGRHPYLYIPFSKGPRNCIGWLYAHHFLKMFVITVFRRFRFTTTMTSKPGEIKFIFGISSTMIEQPLFKVEDRFI